MIRKLKIFGLSAAAALALIAVAASSAFAFEFFESEKSLSAFRGLQNESSEWKLAGNTFLCANKGEVSGGVIRGMFTPEKAEILETSDSAEGGKGVAYGECTFEGVKATFTSNHCNFRFHAQLQTLDIIKNGSAAEENECKEKGMVFTAGECEVEIKPEAKNEGLPSNPPPELYENLGMKTERYVLIKPTYKKIRYTASEECPSGEGTFENGEYLRGSLEVKGYTGTKFAVRSGLFLK